MNKKDFNKSVCFYIPKELVSKIERSVRLFGNRRVHCAAALAFSKLTDKEQVDAIQEFIVFELHTLSAE